jgi:hypothetical protein
VCGGASAKTVRCTNPAVSSSRSCKASLCDAGELAMQLAKPANTRHTKVPQYQHLPLAGKDLHRPFDQPGISIRGSLDGHLTGSILIVGARNVSTWAPSLYCMILSMGTAGCRRARSSCGRLSLDGWEAAREIHLPQKVTHAQTNPLLALHSAAGRLASVGAFLGG